ncbi:MAG: DNA methyltransferase [Xanthobacteraceae bacterium]
MASKRVRPVRLRFEERRPKRLTHYLFRYPAKFHPPIVAALIKKFSRRGDLILDPFCGSATALVEARVLRRNGIGIDVDPVAAFIADAKTRYVGVKALRRSTALLLKRLQELRRSLKEYERLQFADISDRAFRTTITTDRLQVPAIPNLFHWFRRYVVVDLALIRSTIMSLRIPPAHKNFFLACFCSIIRNVSNADPVPVSGLEVTSHMKRKDKEGRIIDPFVNFESALERALQDRTEFESAIRGSGTNIRIGNGDATKLRKYVRTKVDLVITSPPYHNAVDYYRRHTLEMYWLDLVESHEDRLDLLPKYIGRSRIQRMHPYLNGGKLESWFARRCESMMRNVDARSADAFKHYAVAMQRSFAALADMVKPSGNVVFVLGKSSWNGRRLPTTKLYEELASPHFQICEHYWYPLKNRYMTYSRHNGASIDTEHVLVFRHTPKRKARKVR